MSSPRRLLCCSCMVALACSQVTNTPQPLRRAHLPVGVVAQVGADEIALSTVQRIVDAQHVSPKEARDRALSDAVFAAAARSSLDNGSLVPVVERAAWARALLEVMKHDALARGPASDAEVAVLTAQRWRELDRPESVRTTHAVALVAKPEDDAKARAVAQQIHDAVSNAASPEEFMRLAKAVPHDGVDVRIERLPAVTADARVYDPDKPAGDTNQSFDPDFAKAAYALQPGQISEPAKSSFGYHVIFCEARLPEARMPLEQRRQLLHDDAIKGRAEHAKQELLASLGAAQPIPISRAADDLTARVQVTE
jgi:hypothetical protein